MTIEILLNGESQTIEEGTTLDGLMATLDFDRAVGAIAVNRVFVPRDCYADTQLQSGDEVEVLAPIFGG
jgi:thiamine biosynthesis protein ThiS